MGIILKKKTEFKPLKETNLRVDQANYFTPSLLQNKYQL